MPEIICNTSPLQYLHQVGLLHLLSDLAARVVVPSAVAREMSAGRAEGVDLPVPEQLDWVIVREPHGAPLIPLVVDLGAGETEVLALALESANAEVLLDDALARRVARMLGLPCRGTLGLLLDAKKAGLVAAVGPILDRLTSLGFPALQYARISLARDLIRDRTGVGLSQQRLADLAGVRQETLSRIETGRHTASQRTIDKIMRAIEAERRRVKKR